MTALLPAAENPAATGLRRPTLSLIAAVADNGVIGRNNQLPWHLPEDLAHFRQVTQGHAVLMGRKTWDSLPPRFRPLPGRRNLVLSRDPAWQAAGAEACSSLSQALTTLAGCDKVFVIGGAQLYATALPLADELVLTEIHHTFDGDTQFPHWDRQGFDAIHCERHPASAERPFAFSFVTYQRKS